VKQGQQISNPRTGQRMTIISADRAELRLDTLNPPTAVREPMHVHPRQESGAEVLTGSLIFEVAGERRRIAAGEKIAIAANTPHRFWNEGPDDARAVQRDAQAIGPDRDGPRIRRRDPPYKPAMAGTAGRRPGSRPDRACARVSRQAFPAGRCPLTERRSC
jgi:mannose-6-phosphate isomerase-like protein (cupin superfamily)